MQGQRKIVLHHRFLAGSRIEVGIDQNDLPYLVGGEAVHKLRSQFNSLIVCRFVGHFLVISPQRESILHHSLSYLSADSIYINILIGITQGTQILHDLPELLYHIGVERSAKRRIGRKSHNGNPSDILPVRQGIRRNILKFKRRIGTSSETQGVMQGFLQIVILKHPGKDVMKLLLIRQLACNGRLSLAKLRRSDHLHRGSDLQRVLHRSESGFYFLQ